MESVGLSLEKGAEWRSRILHIRLLGGFSLVFGTTPVLGVNTARLQSLLAYLILHAASPQSRQYVAFLLWPDAQESHARNNLRQLLYQLRHALPDPDRFLFADANVVHWQIDEAQTVDVQLFKRALAQADTAEQLGDLSVLRHWLEHALSYYQGDLLPSCYDDWITPERDRLRQQAHDAHRRLVRVLESQREYAAALQTAQHLLQLDPLDEDTYILLMRLHSLNQDRQGVRRIYQSAVETLRRELGVEPGEALRQAYERLQHTAETYPSSVVREASAGTLLTLVGRQAEWLQLQATWQRAARGEAQLALVTGEAGIGKSRLAEELFNWVKQQGGAAAYTRCYAAEGSLLLAPVTEWLRSGALYPRLASLDRLWLTEVARVLPEILTERADLARPEPISEYGQRQRFFEALARAVLAAPGPCLLWIDDLQWCDLETLEWLHFLLRFKPHSPLLVLGTARSEESPPDHPLTALVRQLRNEDRLVSIELSPLDAAETAKLASQVAGQGISAAAALRLYHETEGNPLFVVETVRAGMGSAMEDEAATFSAQAAHDSHTLPPRVYAVIAGRLAQLSPSARKVAEVGAAIGRAFTLDVLRHAANEDEESVIRALDELWQKRILREQSINLFDFTHDKLRDVAYAETSAPQRRLLHRRIAQTLEALNADDLDPVSAQVAAQYEQAGMFQQAIPYYQRAGSVAASVYANEDAINLLTRGLALLSQLPPSAKRDTQELTLQLALAPLYRITKGWASPEIESLMNRALVLSDKVGDIVQRVQTLYGLQSMYVVAARLEKVEYTYAEMLKLFMQTQGNPPAFAALMHAGAKLHMGHLVEAREQFERIVAVRDDKHIRDLQESQGVNYLAHGHAWNSHAVWCLGYPQTALQWATAAVQLAREFAQPFNQALTITYLAMLQELRADMETFHAHAEEALVLTHEYKAPYYHAWASILAHFARAWQQTDSGSLARLRDAIRDFTETGARLRLPYYLSLLARACYKAGELEEGLAVIEQALSESLQNNERWWDTELHRLRGELMWAQGADVSDIEAAFQRAVNIAQAQQAKSLELRAATSLARLWQAISRSADAKRLLTPLVGRFTEGLDTPDWQAAQALIAQL